MATTVEISNYDELMKQLEDCPKDLAKGVRGITLGLVKRNASGGSQIKAIASTEVRKVYAITKGKFDARASYHYDETSSIKLSGETIPFFEVEFKSAPSHTFTAVNFGMTPTKRYARNRAYTVQWSPLRAGGKVALKSSNGLPVFLAAPRGVMLPWHRLGKPRKPVEVVRTHLSPPQMIDNPKVRPQIQTEIEKRIEEKLNALVK